MLTQGSLLTISEVLSPSEELVFCFSGLIQQLPEEIDVLEFANNYRFLKETNDLLEIVQTAMKGPYTHVRRYDEDLYICAKGHRVFKLDEDDKIYYYGYFK